MAHKLITIHSKSWLSVVCHFTYYPCVLDYHISSEADDALDSLDDHLKKLGVWSDLHVVQAGTSIRMANRPGGQKRQNWNEQGNLEPAAVFFQLYILQSSQEKSHLRHSVTDGHT